MRQKELHLSDESLLLAADGELSPRRARKVRAHLAGCWVCRAKLAEMEGAIAKFVRFQHETLDSQLPLARASRARLESQLAELADRLNMGFWMRLRHSLPSPRAAAYVCFVLAIAAAVGHFWWQHSIAAETQSLAGEGQVASMLPDRKLTPGAIRPVAVNEVCSMAHEEVELQVPNSLRDKVFREYGMVRPRAENYEIDYLITPGLGGTDDIHNLWPEPYRSVTWNARVKDALEERMHEMVCSGNLDLSTAQNDIAKDWIAAYKKYFHTEEPVGNSESLGLPITETARANFEMPFRLAIAVQGKS